jgi:hypothetical protein
LTPGEISVLQLGWTVQQEQQQRHAGENPERRQQKQQATTNARQRFLENRGLN